MKLPSEMLQNLPYFWKRKIQIILFSFSFPKIWQILKHFTRQFIDHKHLISEKCQTIQFGMSNTFKKPII